MSVSVHMSGVLPVGATWLARPLPALAVLLALFTSGLCDRVTLAQEQQKFDQAIKDFKKIEGLWTIYTKEQQIYVDLKNGQLSQDYLILSSIAKGVSVGDVIGGMTWGDDVLWTFRKVGDKVHVIRRNVKFRARPGSPEASAVRVAYSDSVLYALPIVAESNGGQLVDMTRIFLSDDEQIGQRLRAGFVMDRSTIDSVKGFPRNMEIDVAAVYAGQAVGDTVIDPRGMQVGVHYSISALPSNGYKPRLADDRIGYFLTVTKDFSDDQDDENFVRYINRWDLQKADPAAKLSPPKEQIIFWLEKTVPIRLRPIVQAGIEEWNRAFEKIGFANAIEVRQQREEDTWDPEDVRYNTFRWITANAGFAMGPSRVNPLTGQILDADIIFDADFLRYWKQDVDDFSPKGMSRILGLPTVTGPQPLMTARAQQAICRMNTGMEHQLGFAAAAMMAEGASGPEGELPDEYIFQALKHVVMHEVGHTLGLRHNFKASSWKTLAEIDDANRSKTEPIVASVMDYSPGNINPAGAIQSSYYATMLGPYDHWAIDYGYRIINGDEAAELAKVAARSSEPGHDFLSDSDTRGSIDPDPLTNRFDLGKDPVAYAQRQTAAVNALLPKISDKVAKEGQGYQRVRQAFSRLYSEYWRSLFFAARQPGGVYVNRDHKGTPNGRLPFKPVEAAQQRAAMTLIMQQAFQAPKFDPTLLNSLGSNFWDHWGARVPSRSDFPIHDVVLQMQSNILDQLLASTTQQRILDGEVKVAPNEDAYTLAEHYTALMNGIFGELLAEPGAGEFTPRTPFLPSYRRNLQRAAALHLIRVVTQDGSDGNPEDARVLTRMHLTRLLEAIAKHTAKAELKLDDYSRAHLIDTSERIRHALEGKVAAGGGSGGIILLQLGQPVPGQPISAVPVTPRSLQALGMDVGTAVPGLTVPASVIATELPGLAEPGAGVSLVPATATP